MTTTAPVDSSCETVSSTAVDVAGKYGVKLQLLCGWQRLGRPHVDYLSDSSLKAMALDNHTYGKLRKAKRVEDLHQSYRRAPWPPAASDLRTACAMRLTDQPGAPRAPKR